jgi:hypothetical protein
MIEWSLEQARALGEPRLRVAALAGLASSLAGKERATIVGQCLDDIPRVPQSEDRSKHLTQLAPAVDVSHFVRFMSVVEAQPLDFEKIAILTATSRSLFPNQVVVDAIRRHLRSALRGFAESTFGSVMHFCPIRQAFQPPVVSRDACRMAATDIYDVVQRWRWL